MKKILITIITTMLVTNAYAGGFQLSEYSLTQLGRAFAGYGVVGDDYSAIAYNPAGMCLRNSGAQTGVTIVALNSEVTGRVDGIKGKDGRLKDHPPVPHVFAQYKANDKTRIGFAAYTPYSFATNYSKYWFGRSHALESRITTIDYELAASYNLTPKLTLGAAIIAETLEAKLTNNVDGYSLAGLNSRSKVHGDSFEAVYDLGLLYKLGENTRLGLSYHSRAVHQIRGAHKVNTPMGDMYSHAGTKLVLPEYYTLSAYHQINKIGLSASLKWTNWSKFKTLDIWSSSNPYGVRRSVGAVDENWRDTWMVSLGTDYYYNDKWTFRAGISYDQAGVRDAEHRTARVPDANRWILGVGASYKINDKMQVDAGYSHVFMQTSKSRNQLPNNGSTLQAKFNSSINMVGISFQYNF
ncbi:MAG: outer membrane protein transport protein [Alphaproteobacteria bacterium]|nr:outer membrane protein transport protein [Alphaproteobacteria bacterium]